jgi:hypothetical protein
MSDKLLDAEINAMSDHKWSYVIDLEDLQKCKLFLENFRSLNFFTWVDDVELMSLIEHRTNRIEYIKSKMGLDEYIKFKEFIKRCQTPVDVEYLAEAR